LGRAILLIATIVAIWLLGANAMANAMTVEGLITLQSKYGPAETMSRLETAVKSKGLTIFARVDHAAGAREVGLTLRPTELLIFGNAKGGTPLMQSVQTIGIDLPLKVLVWEDSAGVTWLSYNDPHWLARRHRLDNSVEKSIVAMTAALNAMVTAAAGSPS
jgi:uncharacterized protein (DUF302 family)